MKPASEVTACIVDYGLYVELARVLGTVFKKVYYCNPCWPKPFPRLNEAMVGTGFDEIELCMSPFDHASEIDLYCFFDIGQGQMQLHLESLGYKVWGARMAEDLEFNRAESKELMAAQGLPIGPYEVLYGMKDLRKYLKDKQDVYVKVSKWRGHFESMYVKNYKYIEPKLTEMEQQLGPLDDQAEFIVEEPLPDRFEVAIDQYTVDGQFPGRTLYGVEIKDQGYIGVFTQRQRIPAPLREFDTKMSPIFKDMGAKTFLSAETRIGKDKIAYILDPCLRCPLPPTELYEVFYSNLPDIIWQGANGILVDPDPVAKWGAEILLLSEWAGKHFQPVDVPLDMQPFVKFRNATMIDGRYYVLPQSGEAPEIGAVVGYGNTMEEAIEMAKEVASSIEGYDVETPEHSLDKAVEEIDKAKEFGVWVEGE